MNFPDVWEWFLHFLVERTESDLSKINWLCGFILLNPIVLMPWGRFPLCHTPIRPIRLSGIRSQPWSWVVWPRDTRFASVPLLKIQKLLFVFLSLLSGIIPLLKFLSKISPPQPLSCSPFSYSLPLKVDTLSQ